MGKVGTRNERRVQRILESHPSSRKGLNRKAYWTLMHWYSLVQWFLTQADKEEPLWYFPHSPQGSEDINYRRKRYRAFWFLRPWHLTINVWQFEDSKVTLGYGPNGQVLTEDNYKEVLGQLITRYRLANNILETWTS